SITRCEIGKQLLNRVLPILRFFTAYECSYLTASMQISALRERDEFLCDRTDFLRLRFRRLNPFIDEQVRYEVAKQCLTGAGITASLLVCGHGISLPYAI